MIFQSKLYAITDENLLSRKVFLRQARQALAAGARMIQLREKMTRLRDRLELGQALAALVHRHGAQLIVNDDPILAAQIGADGVHLGNDDPPLEMARALLGEKAVIGISCYGNIRRAIEMEKRGASYVSFGACFKSPTKPNEALVPLAIFSAAKKKLHIPVVAIGGISVGNARPILEAGADCLAVVSSVFASADAGRAVHAFKTSLKD